MSSLDESLRSLSVDYLNLLINGQAFGDVTFSVEGRLVHAHRCILAARSLFFRKFFCGGTQSADPCSPSTSPRGGGMNIQNHQQQQQVVIPVNSVGYEVFMLMLQFLYSGQVSIIPQKHEARPNCGERGCWHTHCSSAVQLALDTLAAATSFGVEHLALLTQKQLAIMVEKASIEDVMKVLSASRKHDMHQLWTTCSHLVAKSGLPPEILAKHLPIEVVAKIEELRLKTNLSRRNSLMSHHPHQLPADLEDQRIRRMRRALDSSDVELVKLMVMGEGLNLDEAFALHYAVRNCSREVVKALLELGAADVNYPAGPNAKTPLHLAAELVSPDMVAVLLDHHADPNVKTVEGVTPLDILRGLTSDFLFKGAVPGLNHIEPNKLRLCLELVQSAALVISREEGNNNNNNNDSSAGGSNPGSSTMEGIYGGMSEGGGRSTTSSGGNVGHGGLNLDPRLVYLNLGAGGATTTQLGDHDDDQVSHHGNTAAAQREAMNIGRHGGGHGMYHHHHDTY